MPAPKAATLRQGAVLPSEHEKRNNTVPARAVHDGDWPFSNDKSNTVRYPDEGYLGRNDSLLKGDVWIGDIRGSLITMKPKPAAW
jgi:hypothetical protein